MARPKAKVTRDTNKAIYTVAELARMAGNPTRQMRRVLEQLKVPIHKAGNGRSDEVFLADLRTHADDLWESILDRVSALPQDDAC